MRKSSTVLWWVYVIGGLFVAAVVIWIGSIFYTNYLAMVDEAKRASIDANQIQVTPPPTDDSDQTKSDVAALIDLRSARDEDDVEKITSEMPITNAQFVGYRVAQYADKATFPKLSRVFLYSWDEVNRVLTLKQNEFNRTRPSVLHPEIEPIVPVPAHPGYPADQATLARFVASVLSKVDPAHETQYFARANELAYHQEIAGIQYAFDDAVSAKFADDIFALLQKDPIFTERLEAAKAEWIATDHPSQADLDAPPLE
jgi:hypothetical protein